MLSVVKDMLLNHDLCVLCTSKNDVPDASLMLYIINDHCTKMHMLTLKETSKYVNIMGNPNVSLLIDTRDDTQDKTIQTMALTAHGLASIVEDDEISKKILEKLIRKHAQLSNLASNESVRVIEVLIKSILFLENADKVNNVELPDT